MARKLKESPDTVIRRLFQFSILVSLVFWVPHLDSFNVSKQSLLVVGTFALVGAFIGLSRSEFRSNFDLVIISVIIWLGSLITSWLSAPSWQLALWGPAGRLTGLITYLCFAALFVITYLGSSSGTVVYLLRSLTILGAIQTGYSLLQLAGRDPISWNNPYGLVIGTLGNSNFAAALNAICFLATVWLAVEYERGIKKYFVIAISLIQLFVIVASQVRQGLVISAFGMLTVICYRSLLKSKKIGVVVLLVSICIAFASILGGLSKGPLRALIYKDSLTLRGDYWRVALEMFQNNPVLGIGLGHFGQYFALYRDELQASRRGPEFVTDQAHNVPLEFLATGGLILFLSYLGVIISVFYLVIRSARANTLRENRDLVVVTSIWTAYLLQSLISIDQIGVAIWGWITLGSVGAIARRKSPRPPVRHKRKSFPRVALVIVLSSVGIALVVPQWRADQVLKKAYETSSLELSSPEGRGDLLGVLNNPLLLSYYDSEAALILLSKGIGDGITWAIRALEKNPDDIDALRYIVVFGKQSSNDEILREFAPRLRALDPYSNLLP